MAVVTDYTALLYYTSNSFGRWNSLSRPGTPAVVTYSFVETDELGDAASDPYGATSYWSYSNAQRTVFRQAIEAYEDAAGIVFVETGGRAMVNVFGYSGGTAAGWANLPWASSFATSRGDVAIQGSSISPGSFGYETILHELGHAVGLKHPHSGDPVLAEHLDTQENTVMTYNYAGYNVSDLGPLDLQALQHIYGGASATADWDVRLGAAGQVVIDASHRWETLLATGQDTNIHARGGNDRVFGREGDDKLRGGWGNDTLKGGYGSDTLWGQSGDDVLIGAVNKDSRSGSGNDGDLLHGGKGKDKIWGSRGEDTLKGGFGSDRLTGGDGSDILSGGQQGDVFVFVTADYWEDEIITDFGTGKDKIEFSGTQIDEFSDLTISQQGGSTFISFQGQHDVELTGYTGALTADHFIFT
ncbi:M12 family metallopeptidase [Leisingera sp. ANG-Vp]|uniref:M12 family metallopeptidase n=1 Tax=Leisingera sp. ANG-Vp TaxID=1577896 RepID=UPI00057EE123|nr:M12 family metallopeptidase [Leisingera sp. ANG-Vp]KIC21010.1 type I secretion protein [Leisingera sp. ANG-Vp]